MEQGELQDQIKDTNSEKINELDTPFKTAPPKFTKLKQFQYPTKSLSEYRKKEMKYQKELQKALENNNSIGDYFDEFQDKIGLTLDHLTVFLNKRYSTMTELLNNVNKKLEEYDNKLKRLENKISRNKTIRLILEDMAKFQQFAQLLQQDIEKINEKIGKQNKKAEILSSIKNNKKDILDRQNWENLNITNQITKLKKALKKYEEFKNNNHNSTHNISQILIDQQNQQKSYNHIEKIEKYCGSYNVIQSQKKPKTDTSVIQSKSFKIKLNSQNQFSSSSHDPQLQGTTRTDFRKTFLRQTYFSKISSQQQQYRSTSTEKFNLQNSLDSFQKYPRTTEGKNKRINNDKIRQQLSTSSNQPFRQHAQGGHPLEKIFTNINIIKPDFNSSQNVKQQRATISEQQDAISDQVDEKIKQQQFKDDFENKEIIKDKVLDQQFLMQDLESSIDEMQFYKEQNKKLKSKLLIDINHFFDFQNLFNSCFDIYLKQLEKDQRKVSNSEQGMQGSLLFEISKTKNSLSYQGFENKRQTNTLMMNRQMQNCIYNTLKTMVDNKQNKKKPKQNLNLEWEAFLDFTPLQIIGVMTLRPETFNEIKWLFQKKTKLFKLILEKYKPILNQISTQN